MSRALVFGDLIALTVCWIASYLIRFKSGTIPIFTEVPEFSLYVVALLAASPLYVFVLQTLGNYHERRGKLSEYEIQLLFRSLALFYLLCLAATFFIRSDEFSRITVVLAFFLNFLGCLSFRVILAQRQARLWRQGIGITTIVLAGKDREVLREVTSTFPESSITGYELIGTIVLDPAQATDLYSQNADRLLLVGGEFTFTEISDVLLSAPDHLRIDLVPSAPFLFRHLAFREYIGNLPILQLSQVLQPAWNSFSKRVMDVSISLCILLIFAPLLLIISALTLMLYGRPVFYRQIRVGQNGRPFHIYKFRTMKTGAEEDTNLWIEQNRQPNFKWKNDPRVLGRFARFLRRSGLDELPQLWNVMEGSMSLVGPRPAPLQFVRNYNPEQKLRLAMLPGITGLQQVHCRGTASMDQILQYDLRYFNKQNIILDVSILFRTVLILFLGKGTH